MCVIAVCAEEGIRPTSDQVRRMWHHNDHGGGVAWREEGKVIWRKGLTLEEMLEYAETMPFPNILHFRIASIGGRRPELTHPFVVADQFEQSLELTGESDRGVVFHNGHWADWHDALLAGSQRAKEEVPRGHWSDSRAMAWLFRYYGMGFLDTLAGQRTVVLTPTRLDFGIGDGWYKKDGIWFSNSVWDYDYNSRTYYVCRAKGCFVNQNLNEHGYCKSCVQKHNQAQSQALSQAQSQIQLLPGAGSRGGQHEGPFDPATLLARGELAWALVMAGVFQKDQARAVCSKNGLKNLRRDALKAKMKAQKLQAAAVSSTSLM
jgi:hypothetical protein